MKFAAIIQARMGSSRLPGKILMPLAGRPVLQHVIERVRDAGVFDNIVVATTDRAADDAVAALAIACGALAVRGDEDDVLSRYGLAADAVAAEAIMRITADCPLIDPDILQLMVKRFIELSPIDMLSNCIHRTFPRGLDAELFTRAALDAALREASEPSHHEHVTPYIYGHPERFRIAEFTNSVDSSALRLTLDTAEDFALLELVFGAFADATKIRLPDILMVFAKHPEWALINAHIEQKKV